MTYSETVELYQAALEHYRAAVSDDAPAQVIEELDEDRDRALQAMEVAWLEARLQLR